MQLNLLSLAQLRQAAKQGNIGNLKDLLDNARTDGVIDGRDKWGHTAQMEAAEKGFNSCVSLLLEHGADQGCKLEGDQGGHPAPLPSRLHTCRIPTHFLLDLHGIEWKLPTFGPRG